MIIGVGTALIAVFMIQVYLKGQQRAIMEEAKRKLASAQANQVSVLVAKRDIPQGAAIDPASFEISIVPNQYVQPKAVTSLDRISGMVTVASISKGEQLTLSKLGYVGSKQPRGLAEATPIGKRAVTVAVDNIASLAGMVKAGDYVDVITVIAVPVMGPDGKQASQASVVPLFQNVLVLAVGQDTGVLAREDSRRRAEEKKESSPLITLALGPQEANLFAFVQEQGKIRLVLRSPADSQVQPVQPASWDMLFQYIMPPQAKTDVSEKKEAPSVEIYRGLKKEKITLSN